jgi:hypothetical protein
MTETRYSIDLHENTRTGRLLKAALGIVCLAVAVWFLFSIRGTAASLGTAWIAIVFLLLFSIWLIGSGFGLTERYITVGDERIILKRDFYRPPVIFTISSLKAVEFRPLLITFFSGERKTSLRMGAYYPEHSAAIMEAVEAFCRQHGIGILGDNQTEGESQP